MRETSWVFQLSCFRRESLHRRGVPKYQESGHFLAWVQALVCLLTWLKKGPLQVSVRVKSLIYDTTVGVYATARWMVHPWKVPSKVEGEKTSLWHSSENFGRIEATKLHKGCFILGKPSTPWFEKTCSFHVGAWGPAIHWSFRDGVVAPATTPSPRPHWNQECLLWADSACWARGRVPQTKSSDVQGVTGPSISYRPDPIDLPTSKFKLV